MTSKVAKTLSLIDLLLIKADQASKIMTVEYPLTDWLKPWPLFYTPHYIKQLVKVLHRCRVVAFGNQNYIGEIKVGRKM